MDGLRFKYRIDASHTYTNKESFEMLDNDNHGTRLGVPEEDPNMGR